MVLVRFQDCAAAQVIDVTQALQWSLSETERQALDQASKTTVARMPANPFQSA